MSHDFKAIAPTIHLLKAIAITMSLDFKPIASTIISTKAISFYNQ
ncbi:hypothetical protein [Pseudanabaena cinerea]|nr:hypothetical protein [Pseudanabaena cinerea]